MRSYTDTDIDTYSYQLQTSIYCHIDGTEKHTVSISRYINSFCSLVFLTKFASSLIKPIKKSFNLRRFSFLSYFFSEMCKSVLSFIINLFLFFYELNSA